MTSEQMDLIAKILDSDRYIILYPTKTGLIEIVSHNTDAQAVSRVLIKCANDFKPNQPCKPINE